MGCGPRGDGKYRTTLWSFLLHGKQPLGRPSCTVGLNHARTMPFEQSPSYCGCVGETLFAGIDLASIGIVHRYCRSLIDRSWETGVEWTGGERVGGDVQGSGVVVGAGLLDDAAEGEADLAADEDGVGAASDVPAAVGRVAAPRM